MHVFLNEQYVLVIFFRGFTSKFFQKNITCLKLCMPYSELSTASSKLWFCRHNSFDVVGFQSKTDISEMDCNKDEAVKAKGIAEKKLIEKDITGAKKFALKAQSLFPKLDGLSQFLEIIDVYVAHEKKINGEADYYGIFGVDPFTDEDGLKKQYKRMALSLHPDKNKSVGADGAFKMLSQAWSVLSNKDKRSAYNLKLNIRASNQTCSFSSSSARYTTPVTNPQHVPTRPSAPGTATSQPCSSASHHPRNTTSGTNYPHIPSRQRTPAAATVVGSWYTPAPCHPGNSTPGTSTKHTAAADSQYDPAPQQPLNKTPETSSVNVPDYQKLPASAMQCESIPVPPHPRNPTRPTGNQYSSSRNPQPIPRYQRTPAAASAAQYFPAPRPPFHSRYTPFRNQPTSSTCPSRPETFWTLCNKCKIHYEYQKIYLNQNLLCPRCQQPFLATEMPAPNLNSCSSRPWPSFHKKQDIFAASRGSRSMPPSVTRVSQAASFPPSSKHVKRRHEMAVNMRRENDPLMKNSCTVPENVETASASYTVSSCLKGEKPVKKRRKDAQKCDGAKEGNQGTAGSRSGVNRASANVKGYFGAEQQSRSVKELSQIEIRVMLMGKAKMEILRQLNEWETENSHLKRVATSNFKNALKIDPINHTRTDKSRDRLLSDAKNTSQPRKSSTLKETDLDANPDEYVSMIVPDANFHNFDEDRIEKSFTQGQVWAVYDDDDGMPRYYALIHHVISRSPFKMQISWLNSKSSSEFGSLDWIASGFTKTTGDFRVGKVVVSKRLNSFSHPVKWKKGGRGVIQIFPTKGDVWALYRNWSPDWDEATADEIIHKYDLVVVLQDYHEDIDVLVAPLVKVAGFTSVFNQLLDQTEIQTIPREEMFRFSHQVPFYMLNGLEAENAPKDCYELDPAALPLELLKVITDSESADRRGSEHPVMLRGPGLESAAMAESTSSGKTHAHEERSGFGDAKHVLTYSRRNKGRNTEGDVGQSQR